MHPIGSTAEDRMTLIEAINEATRLGSGFGHTRSQEAQREIMEQALISATTSAEALTAILSRAQKDAGRNRIGEKDEFAEGKPAHKLKGRKKRLEWLDLNGGSMLETHMEHVDLDSLTSVEKRLFARYRNHDFHDADSFAPRPSSMPTESFLSRSPHALLLSRSQPCPAEGEEDPRVELAGGSYAAPYVPSDHSSTTHSSAPASPTGAAAHPPVPGGWMPRSKALGGAGLKHAIREADEAAQGTPVHLRAAQPLTHASLFATLKQFREQQHVRVEDEDLAHF